MNELDRFQPENIIVLQNGINLERDEHFFFDYHDLMKDQSTDCPYESMNAEDLLLILYISELKPSIHIHLFKRRWRRHYHVLT